MKFFLSTLLVVALASLAASTSNTWGRRNGTDYLLMRENVVRQPLRNDYWNVDVTFPKPGQSNTKTITAVYVYDRFTNSSGATPSLWFGGPNYRYATVKLNGQYARGIDSTVEIYGK